ncbi:MAG: 50S ribosomal protein L4 [Bacteroidia bacterium]
MKLDIINIKGESTGRSVELSDDIFNIEPNDHVIYLDVKRYLINQRQGTHKSKERNEVAGSTRKLRKQKGGGGARIGSIKSPVLRGGGRIFGPRPRTYDLKLNKKVRTLARKSALSYKVKENSLFIIEDFDLQAPRTKDFINILSALKLDNRKSMLIINSRLENVIKSSRNLKNTQVITASDINTYNLVNASALMLTESVVNTLNETLK